MFHIVLVEPEIPPNTGNIIRLVANTGSSLHLIEPLGFAMEDRLLRRAGLDYHEYAPVLRYPDWENFLAQQCPDRKRMFALTTRARHAVHDARFRPGDWLVFGCETSGLPDWLRSQFDPARQLRLPMLPTQRSLNLSNAVAITLYEAWRQNDFAGASRSASSAQNLSGPNRGSANGC